jgi:phage-related protein
MSDIGSAYVKIIPTAEGISGQIEQELGGAGEKGGASFSKGFGKVLKGGGVIAGALTAVGTAATSALVSGTKELAEYGDNIDKMSQKMGISAQGYQEWEAVMQHSGTSMETLKASMKTLATAAETNNEAFAQLGITEEQLASMNQEELFNATIASLQTMDDETQRTYLAGQLLGRGATELGALLNTSAEETQAMKDRVHELGGVLSDDAVKDAAAFQDQMQDMSTSLKGVTNGLLSEFLPEVTGVMGGLTEVFAGNMDEGVQQISTGIENLLTSLVNKLPEIITFAGKLIEQLTFALLENTPMILQTGLQIIIELARGIVDAIPQLLPTITQVIIDIVTMLTEPDTLVDLIMCGVDLILALAEGLVEAIPQLIEALPTIITNIVTALIALAPRLVEASIKLIETLGRGLVDSFAALGRAIGELWGKIKDAFMEKIEGVKAWGRDLIDNFINGIKEKWESFKQTLSDLAGTVKDFLGFSEPKEGPLSNFHTFAPDMMDLFMQGIEDKTPELDQVVSQSFDLQPVMAQSMANGDGRGSETNVTVTLQGDASKFFTVMRDQNNIFKKMNGQSAFA